MESMVQVSDFKICSSDESVGVKLLPICLTFRTLPVFSDFTPKVVICFT